MRSASEPTTAYAEAVIEQDLAAYISHELLACAVKVQLVSDVLSEVHDLTDEVPPSVQLNLKSVVRTLQSLGETALSLDPSANLEHHLLPSSVNLAGVIEETGSLFQAQAPGRHIQKYVQLEEAQVWGDYNLLQVVIDNLMSNALKYSPLTTPITITAEPYRALREKDCGQAIISVTNVGTFIPFCEQEKIFTKFYRRDRGKRGQGLGLYLSRQIVELHGGHLDVESLPEGETTFWFTIPLAGC